MEITHAPRLRHALKATVITFLVLALAVTALVATRQPAQAAAQGAGYGTWDDRIGWQGGFVAPDGSIVYCIEPGVSNPSGSTSSAGNQSSVTSTSPFGSRTLSSNDLARINYLVTTFGQTSSSREAAAVNFAVKYIANPGAMFTSHSWNGSWDLHGYVNWVLYSTVGGSEAAAVADRAQALIDAASTVTAGPVEGGSGSLTFQVDNFNNYLGTITMAGTAGSTGTVTLTNGVFTTTGSASLSGMHANTPYPVTGVPPTEDGAPYKISGTGTFTVAGTGWEGAVHVWNTGNQQMTAGPGPRSSTQFSVAGTDPTTRSVLFRPALSTTATAYVQPGEHATDTLTFRTRADSQGLNNPWPQTADGSYRVVNAEGTLYGPFADQPAESDTVPSDARVAGHAAVSTSTTDGPTVTYEATSEEPVDAAGYYTWVWSIDYDNQSAITRMYLPEDYSFTDNFGQTVETSITPMQFTVSTHVVDKEVLLSGPAADTAAVTTDGLWLQQNGQNIPVVTRWDAYYDPRAAADINEVPGTEIPDEAVHLGTHTETVTDNANISTPTTLEDGAIRVPASGEGSIVWVFSILRVDQDDTAGYIVDVVDNYGVPSEISTILQPTVATQASAGGSIGEGIFDTAIIDGHLPANGAQLTFDLYRVPMVQEEDGAWVIDYPTTDANGDPILDNEGNPVTFGPGDLSWVCSPENLVASDTDSLGTTVTENGQYPSFTHELTENGKYLWSEKLWSIPGTDEDGNPVGERELIHAGECGIAEETSFALDVKTVAMSETGATTGIEHGVNVWDTAALTGYVPENGRMNFEAYLVPAGTTACTEDNLAWTSADVPLVGGFYDEDHPLEVKSETHVFDPDVDSTLYFVAVTYDELDREVNRGVCGDPDETLNLKGQKLIATGGDVTTLVVAGAAAALLAGLGIFLMRRRSRS
ncbi:hypothetical protein ASF87_10165 [Microbacterium sp. Leaf161]|uniref:hypothetical protein n=1 Tax=Microbacterium sp. Leaf161 TaxID=1736281 RepID=UPI0006FB547F|nr:hypothetical protein [Microbacterium sp. Leaf161]KQR49149.1 hypothetical protein ASF87_10165 [Microbacterium sp. Leaf161]